MPLYSQEDRPIRITTKLGETELLLERFEGDEAMSTPFEFRVGLLSESKTVDMKSLLRSPACISLRLLDDSERYFHGIFNRLVQLEAGKALTVYEGTLVPWLWFHSLDADCRIFQNKSVPDIVQQIFKDRGHNDFELRLQGSYAPRDYCVQYRETDLNFVSRLLEEEGIFYFFEHSETKHKLVIADKITAFQPCPGQSTFTYNPLESGFYPEDRVLSLVREERVYTGKMALEDYDFEKPSFDLMATVSGADTHDENYDYPGRYIKKDEGERYANIRLEEQEARMLTVSGTSQCRAFTSGYKFTLEEHYRSDTNQDYSLIAVHHEASDNNYRSQQAEPFIYKNTFEAIPHATPYRPPRRAQKGRVKGPQTAVVVGPSGEEIYVDKYGRVKVQFFWDRVGRKDENSSCWVRVSQIWAGKNWGWVTIPRMGQEVVVDFLEGDPDRPIIVGRVYNAEQTVPYALPDNQTQSGIKSRSSKQGGSDDFNEIRFEDRKGSEMITVHAQKDMDTLVEHDDTQTVQNDRTIKVDGKHTETIKQDTTIEITEGNHSFTIDQGNDTWRIKMGNQSVKLDMGNQSTKLDLGKAETEALQSIELKVGQSSVKLDQMGVTIKGMMISIEGQIQVQVKGLMTQVNGDAMLMLKGGITMIN